MSPHEPDHSDGDLVKRYRQASDTEAALPSPKTREAILAEGRRIAAQRAANPTTHRFDPKRPAANQSRWRLAAAGTVGAGLLAAVLMFPHLGAPPSSSMAEMASVPAASPAPARQPMTFGPPAGPLDKVQESDARRASPPPAPIRARNTPSAQSREAPNSNDSADGVLFESQDANRSASAGAQVASTAAPAAPSASSARALPPAMAGRPLRSNLPDDSLSASVQSGDLARLGALLEAGVNPQQGDSQGRTPLLLAVMAHREDMVELLLAHHADPNTADFSGETPLHRSRHDDLSNITRLLERAGAR